jgi:Zn-dependent protease
MSEFYDIDSTHISHREYWWGSRSPLVLIGWLIKWLRIRIPSSTDDPNVDSTLPFLTDALPPEIDAAFQPLTAEFTALGFVDPVYQVISDPGTRTTIYWSTFRHSSGHYFARIHHRVWHQAQKPNRGLFPIFFSAFTDGTFLISSAGKPDMATPDTVRMNYMRGADATALFAAHQRLNGTLSERKMIAPVTSREDLLSTTERHHALMRDFHLARSVFRPRSAAAQAKAAEFAAVVAQAQASGQQYPEVLAELLRLQEKKPGWIAAVWVLAGSLVLFFALGAARWDWKFTLWIIPVLLLHEGGHWVAMRLFHYRNLRMFFIPLFGAAVTGQNWNVAGWKKALVSLAGPLPGIALGVVLGIAGLVLKHPWLINAALVLLLVNGLNLLPFLPLDGGHVLQDTLFCRNRWLDGAFRILAILGMILLGTFGRMSLLKYVAIAMVFALPVVFRLSKVADELRRQALPPPLPGQDHIPVPTAQAIITAVRAGFPAKIALSNKMLAQHTVTVFERLNARPPGVLATLALLFLHGGAFLAALIVGCLLVVAQHGGLGDFMSAAVRQPRHSFQPGDIQTWPDQSPATNSTARTLVVSTLKTRAAARNAFTALTNTVPPAATLSRLGDSLVLSLPADDDAARETVFNEFQAHSSNTFVALSNASVVVSLTFIAPDKTTATNLTLELKNYFATAGQMRLIPPWSPEAQRPGFAHWRQARQQLSLISHELAQTWHNPAFKEYSTRIEVAFKRGSHAEAVRLEQEQATKQHQLHTETLQQLRSESPQRVPPALLDLYARLDRLNVTNRAERTALFREVADKLGEVRYAGAEPAPGATAFGATTGTVMGHGLSSKSAGSTSATSPTASPP